MQLLLTLGVLELHGSSYANPKPLLLLAFLALEGRQQRRRLASLFWPFASDPLNRLSVTASRLNKNLSGSLVADGAGLATPFGCDVIELNNALAEGDLPRVDELYGGRFLDTVNVPRLGEELLEWIDETGDRLTRQVQALFLANAEAMAAARRFDEAAKLVSSVLSRTDASSLEPAQLVSAHDLLLAGGNAATGNLQVDVEGLGLMTAIDPVEAREKLAPRPPEISAAGGFKPLPSPMFGRKSELRLLATLLIDERRRLVTVTGPGGIGKTRLAVGALEKLARERPDAYPGDCIFVDCGELDTEARVLQALYKCLRLPQPAIGPSINHLAAELTDRDPVLVLLDGFEQLAGNGRFVTELVASCPSISLLLTSTQALGVRSEVVLSLEGLPDPDVSRDDAAFKLFQERARHADAGFELSPEVSAHVADICRYTGGNPLALELAAAWVAIMPVADIAAEVASGLDILVSQGRDENVRQGSIRAVFDRSWDLLAERERTCMQHLSVFRGGFDRAAAAAVADAGIAELAGLRRKSMLTMAANGRFLLPDTLCRFVFERLGDEEHMQGVRARHAAHLLSVVRRAGEQVNDADGGSALEQLDTERANVVAAMGWALEERQLDMLAGFAEAQSNYWVRRGLLAVAVEWYRAVEELASCLAEQSDRTLAPSTSRTGKPLDPSRHANVLRQHAFVSFTMGDVETPRRLLRQSLELCGAADDTEGKARTNLAVGIMAVYKCDYIAARAHYLRALDLGREHGLKDVVARALNNLGDVHLFKNDFDSARAYFEESLALLRASGDRQMISNVLGSLGVVAIGRGRLVDAESALRESLSLVESLGITFSLSTAFEQYASLFTVGHRPLLAAELWGAAGSLRQRLGTPLEPFAVTSVQEQMENAGTSVSADEFARHLALGRQLDPGQAVELALTEGASLASRVAREVVPGGRSGDGAAPGRPAGVSAASAEPVIAPS